jgi:hypothetical protein
MLLFLIPVSFNIALVELCNFDTAEVELFVLLGIDILIMLILVEPPPASFFPFSSNAFIYNYSCLLSKLVNTLLFCSLELSVTCHPAYY